MIYKYFISYKFRQGDGLGCGNCFLETKSPILSNNDIRRIEDDLEYDLSEDSVCIDNFILLSEKEDA